ncbi:MAG: thrombospondin type 3 repeat-containing protein [Bacteroidota bacterium]|nr:thrombospondin type 3 repeat-containing protein [Bacteroidota bacterium]
MKKTILLLLIVAFAATVNGQTSDKKWGLGLGVGAYGTVTEDGGIGFMPELYLSRYLSPRLDLMLKTDMGLFRSDLINKLDLVNPFMNLRYKFSDETKNFRPYLFAGPGLLWDNQETGLNFDAGLGAKYYFSPSTALYFDAGYINGISITRAGKDVKDNFIKGTIGLEFDFGKTQDSDMDGVSDKKDKCPNTPAGVAVDKDGCPLDSDGDGVPDYLDDCPTVPGLTSLKGCPDADGDGVADKDDKCPDTPKGVKVDKDGCPLDSDKDGVHDGIDKCPDTPAGVVVDKDGCPIDTDGDGTPDYLDDCPTVAGPKENKGCPVKELTAEEIEALKMKVEPVYFDFDKSAVKAIEKSKIDKLVTLLKENSNYSVNITGHADNVGSDDYNLNLSKNRNASVVRAITAAGIRKNRILSTKPLGESSPAATNDTEEGRALNRRVEFEVIKK